MIGESKAIPLWGKTKGQYMYKYGNKVAARLLALAAVAAMAASPVLATDPPDASDIVTTASSTFNTVGALIVSVVGFFVIVKIVKWIRK